MRVLPTLYVLAFPLYAIAAPVPMAQDKSPAQAGKFSSGLHQEPVIEAPIKVTTRVPGGVPVKKESKASRSRPKKGERPVSSNSAVKSPSSSKKPSPKPKSSYLASLAHRLTSKSPFSESSTVREETKASREDWEPEATIVEWETKASREAYIWVPCFSNDKTIRYHRVRVNTDMLVVTLVLSLTAIIIVIEVWRPISARLRRFRSGHGPIYLDTNEVMDKEDLGQKAYRFQESKLEESIVEEGIDSQQVTIQAEIVATKS